MNDGLGVLVGLVLTVVILIFLFSMKDDAYVPPSDDFNIVCLDGVEYWHRYAGYKGVMAPRFDADTKQVVTCDG